MRIVIENTDGQATVDPILLRNSGSCSQHSGTPDAEYRSTVHNIATCVHLLPSTSSSLASNIVTSITNGRNPPTLTAKKLMWLSAQLSIDWPNSESCSVSMTPE